MSFSFIPSQAETVDPIASFLFKAVKTIIIGLICLLPIVWLQPGFLMLLPVKSLLLVLVVALAVIFGSLAVLRQAKLHLSLYAPVIAWWGVVLVGVVSALLSPSYVEALIGYTISTHTVAFLAILGVLMSVMAVFRDSKQWSLLVIAAFVAPVLFLVLWHVVRLIFGANILSFGILGSPTDTVVGGWNDLAILATLAIGILMVTLVQLPLPRVPKIISCVAILLLLVMLAVINFAVLWYGLGLFSLALLLYVMTKDRVSVSTEPPSIVAITLMTLVSVVSIIFVVAGGSISGYLSSAFGTNFVEVRPSVGATLDIARQSLQQNLLLGVGPNHFSTAWRDFRDISINETIFWNVDFLAAHSYVTTWFITTGLLGIVAWTVFLLLFFYSGLRILLLGSNSDRFWFYIATTSFLVAASVWAISLVYVPGIVVLTYGALATGLLFASAKPLGVSPLISQHVIANHRTSLGFIIATLVLVIMSVGFGYSSTRQFTAVATYASVFSLPPGDSQIDQAVQRIGSAYTIFSRDLYLREMTDLRLAEVYNLLALESPTEAEQRQFEAAITSAIETASEGVRTFGANPINWLSLGNVYLALARAGVEGAGDRAIASYNEAIVRDARNPLYHLQIAIARTTLDDIDGVRASIAEAIRLKSNYFDAYVLLSELEILSGNAEEALNATRSLIALEPRNPGLYYRLGILQLANGNLGDSVNSLTDALRFDAQFANARYVRALIYAEQGNRQQAISELEIVRNQNEENAVVDETIALVRDASTTINALQLITPIQEPQPRTQQDAVLGSEDIDSNLFSPVNTPPSTNTTQSNEDGEPVQDVPETTDSDASDNSEDINQ